MEAIEFTGPYQQAKHLARYIACPSTIRAHCINSWGRAPDLAEIIAWQPRKRAVPKWSQEAPRDTDAIVERLGVLPVLRVRPAPPPPHRPAPAPGPRVAQHPWPKWYSPPCTAFIASDLIASVAKGFNLAPAQLTGAGRTRPLVHARAVVIRIMRERGWSYPRIGNQLGGRDHSTTIHAAESFDIYARQSEQVEAVYRAHREAGWCGNG